MRWLPLLGPWFCPLPVRSKALFRALPDTVGSTPREPAICHTMRPGEPEQKPRLACEPLGRPGRL